MKFFLVLLSFISIVFSSYGEMILTKEGEKLRNERTQKREGMRRLFTPKKTSKELSIDYYVDTLVGRIASRRIELKDNTGTCIHHPVISLEITNVDSVNTFQLLGSNCSSNTCDCYVDYTFLPIQDRSYSSTLCLTVKTIPTDYTTEPTDTECLNIFGEGYKPPYDPEEKEIACGSVIQTDNQTISDSVKITGTGLSLVYSSGNSNQYETEFQRAVRYKSFNPNGVSFSNHHFLVNGEYLSLGTGFQYKKTPKIDNQNNKYIIAHQDEVFEFEKAINGKHLRTRDALTGVVKYVFNYDANDYLIGITDRFGKTITINRDTEGNMISVVSPKGQTTTFELNDQKLISKIIHPDQTNHEFTYFPDTDLLEYFKRPSGHMKNIEYTPVGWLLKVSESGGNSQEFEYYRNENGSTVLDKKTALERFITYETSKDSQGVFTRKKYSNAGYESVFKEFSKYKKTYSNQYSTKEINSNPDERFDINLFREISEIETIKGKTKITEYLQNVILQDPNDYFSFDNLTKTTKINGVDFVTNYNKTTNSLTQTAPSGHVVTTNLNALGLPILIQNGQDQPISYEYNADGNLIKQIFGSGNEHNYTYNAQGFLATTKDSLNQITKYQYDVMGRKIRETYPDGRFTRFVYDVDGRLTRIIPPGRTAHVFSYNGLDEVSQYRPPQVEESALTQTRYYYNNDKQLIRVQRPDGQKIRYVYEEELGQLMTMIFGNNERQRYTYYPLTENIKNITSADGIVTLFTYFNENTVEVEQSTFEDDTFRKQYVFDNFHRPTRKITKLNGTEIGREVVLYDNDGRGIRRGNVRYIYDSVSGRLTNIISGNIHERKVYDIHGNLSSSKVLLVTPAGNTELYFYSLTRNPLFQITTKIERVEGVQNRYDYTYDTSGRLKEVKRNNVIVSENIYDLNGNRVSGIQNGKTFTATYDNQDRLKSFLLEGNDPRLYSYNLNGELIKVEQGTNVTLFTRDGLGRLKTITQPDQSTRAYKLDYLGRRVGEYENNVLKIKNHFDSELSLSFSQDQISQVIREYTTGANVNIADTFKENDQEYKLVKDNLGSLRLVVNIETGAIIQKMNYTEYGEVIEDTNPGLTPFGFAGGFYDQKTKLVKFGARDYDPSVGRWLSKDPILFNGGDTNLYGYVENDPINWIDFSGEVKGTVNYSKEGTGAAGGGGVIYVAPNGQAVLAPPGSVVQSTQKNDGLKISIKPGIQIRLMEPKTLSPNGYGVININGKFYNSKGEIVPKNSSDAHIQPKCE